MTPAKQRAEQQAGRDQPEQDTPAAAMDEPDQPGPTVTFPGRAIADSKAGRHLGLLTCYLAAGIAVTWPRATYLSDGKLPASRDAGSYVWGFWWMARQVEHLGNPWFTRSIAAPNGSADLICDPICTLTPCASSQRLPAAPR